MANFTEEDKLNLLSQPGTFYIRKKSTDPWQSVVFQNGATYSLNTETASIRFDDVGNVKDEVSDETVTINVSSGQVLNLDYIEMLSGGLFTKEVIDGSTVSGETQDITGGYVFNEAYVFENQNGDGSIITVNSVTQDPGGADTSLTEDTDYFVFTLPEVGSAIMFKDTVDTDNTKDLQIDYDYTPSDTVKLKRGGIKSIDSIQVAFETLDPNDEYVVYTFYKVFTDGNLGHGFSPEDAAEPITMDLTFTARKDTNRTANDQLFSIERGRETKLA
jgi:hypothetical protein